MSFSLKKTELSPFLLEFKKFSVSAKSAFVRTLLGGTEDRQTIHKREVHRPRCPCCCRADVEGDIPPWFALTCELRFFLAYGAPFCKTSFVLRCIKSVLMHKKPYFMNKHPIFTVLLLNTPVIFLSACVSAPTSSSTSTPQQQRSVATATSGSTSAPNQNGELAFSTFHDEMFNALSAGDTDRLKKLIKANPSNAIHERNRLQNVIASGRCNAKLAEFTKSLIDIIPIYLSGDEIVLWSTFRKTDEGRVEAKCYSIEENGKWVEITKETYFDTRGKVVKTKILNKRTIPSSTRH